MEGGFGWSVAPGTLAALSNRDDDRAYYTFDGDLGQMGTMETFLRERGFSVVKSGVYPGFPESQEDQYIRALRAIFECRVDGWWGQKQDLIKHGICTQAEYREALRLQCERSKAERDEVK